MSTPRHRQRVARMSRYKEYVLAHHGGGLENYYPLDEHPGATTAIDYGAQGNDGTYEGVVELQSQSITRGLSGAAKGDGATGNISIPAAGLHQMSVPDEVVGTWAFWLRFSRIADASQERAVHNRATESGGVGLVANINNFPDPIEVRWQLEGPGGVVGLHFVRCNEVYGFVFAVFAVEPGGTTRALNHLPNGEVVGSSRGSGNEYDFRTSAELRLLNTSPVSLQHFMAWSRVVPEDEQRELFKRGRGLL